MKDMEHNEGTIYPAARIAQSGVGELEIECMAFQTTYPIDHTKFCHEISIRDASQEQVGWGKEIWKGTLKELIDLVRISQSNEVPKKTPVQVRQTI